MLKEPYGYVGAVQVHCHALPLQKSTGKAVPPVEVALLLGWGWGCLPCCNSLLAVTLWYKN